MGWIIAGIVVYVIYLLVKPKRSKEEKLRQMELEYQQLQEDTKIKEMQKALSKKRSEKMGQRLGYSILLVMALLAYMGIYLGNKEEERIAAMTPEARKAHYAAKAAREASNKKRQKQKEEEKRIAQLPKDLSDARSSLRWEQGEFNTLIRRVESEGFRMPLTYHAQITKEANNLKFQIDAIKRHIHACERHKKSSIRIECKIKGYRSWDWKLDDFTDRWNDIIDDI